MDYVKIKNAEYEGIKIRDRIFKIDEPIEPQDGKMVLTVVGDSPDLNEKIMLALDETDFEWSSFHDYDAQFDVEINVETDEEILSRIDARFSTVETMARAVVDGTITSLIISGPPGVGKSFSVKKVLSEIDTLREIRDMFRLDLPDPLDDLQEEGRITNPDYQIITSYIRPPSLYKALYDYKQEKAITVFDDCDSVMEDEVSLNILKSALDTDKDRLITYGSETSALKGYARNFLYHGSAIFITNKKFDQGGHRLSEHLRALMSRSHYIDLNIDSRRDKFLRIHQVVKRYKMLRQKGISEAEETAIMAYIHDNLDRFSDLSLRTALKLADLMLVDRKGWKELAKWME